MELCSFGGKLSNVEQCKIIEHHHVILKKVLARVVRTTADEPYHLDFIDWDFIDEPGSDTDEDLHL